MNEYLPELTSLAESRGFADLAERLQSPAAQALFTTVAPPDTALDAAAESDLIPLLTQMIRRGLDPALVDAAMGAFEARPLERGLIAWDALTQSTIPDWEATRLNRLQSAAERVRDVLPPPGESGILTTVAPDAVVARFVTDELRAGGVDRWLDGVSIHELAAYEALRLSAGKAIDEVRAAGMLDELRTFARLLALAHLPTLASFYLHYAWRVLGDEQALPLLCETLCDAEAPELSPASLFPDGKPAGDLAEYVTLRTLILRGAPDVAFGRLGELFGGGQAPDVARLSDRIALVYAELGADLGELRVPAQRISQIAVGDRLWRYAARIAVTLALRFSPANSPLPGQAIETFVRSFGDDVRLWRAVLSRPSTDQPWFASALGVLVRETVARPHARPCWQALEYALMPALAASNVRARAVAQSKF